MKFFHMAYTNNKKMGTYNTSITNPVKQKQISLVILFLFSLLQSCSWHEDFLIYNLSAFDVELEYELETISSGYMPIFGTRVKLYKLDNSKNIDRQNPLPVADKDTSLLKLKITLPANTALNIGQLSNDHYKKYNQQFINGRVFNLNTIRVLSKTDTVVIYPKNFDAYFKKENQDIIYRVK